MNDPADKTPQSLLDIMRNLLFFEDIIFKLYYLGPKNTLQSLTFIFGKQKHISSAKIIHLFPLINLAKFMPVLNIATKKVLFIVLT